MVATSWFESWTCVLTGSCRPSSGLCVWADCVDKDCGRSWTTCHTGGTGVSSESAIQEKQLFTFYLLTIFVSIAPIDGDVVFLLVVIKRPVTHFAVFLLHVGHKSLSGGEEVVTFCTFVPRTRRIVVLWGNFLHWWRGRLLLSVVMATVIASIFVIRAAAVGTVWIAELGAEREVDGQIWRTLSGPDCSVDGLERVQTGGLNLKKLHLTTQGFIQEGTFSLLLNACLGEKIFPAHITPGTAHEGQKIYIF